MLSYRLSHGDVKINYGELFHLACIMYAKNNRRKNFMNKMKKLLSVVLAVVLAFSAFSVLGSAAKTAYKTVDELKALDAYSPYGQVTRLSTEERTSIVFDALDNLLPSLNINMGEVFNVLGLSVTIDLTSVDRLCYSFDTIKDTFTDGLAQFAMGIVNLGILESLNVDTWATGMSRDKTAQYTILSELLEFLSANTTLVGKVFSDGLDLGIVSLGDMSSIEDIIMDLPSLVKSLVFPMLERWDDTLTEVKWLDTNGKGDGKVEETVSTFVKNLFNNDMSITTVKYDVNGEMTSEHTKMPFYTAAPGTPSANSPRCYYQITGTTPGSVMTVYHIVDEAEAKALAKTPDKVNGSPAAYTYFKEAQTYVMAQEVEGSDTYVWKATDEWGNTWSMKWYNDDSQFLPGFSGDSINLSTQSLADLLYMFLPYVFENMAPVVLNGSIKKILADFLGADFTYVGQVGDAAVAALPDGSNVFFTQPQGEYLWEWSDYAVINGNHYYRFEDQIFAGDLSNKNNYFDIINWDYEITGDFINEFIPTAPSKDSTFLMNFNNFLIKVAEEALLPSASTVDALSGFEAEWTRPTMTEGGNDKLVANLKAVAQAVIGLAPQHVFGDDYATNERCYVELMLSSDDDTVLTGIAAHLVNMIMPSMSLPGKSDLVASGAKVGAILAAVVREFAAYLAPEYNFDALIYTSYGDVAGQPVKTFVAGKDSGYWFDVILTMGINVGYEYLRAFADMGEGTAQWNSFVAYSGYAPDGKTYAAGTTQEALVAEWEGMFDYILDWALTTDIEWCWKMGNLVTVDGDVNLATFENPWKKLDSVLNALLPIDEILNVEATDCDNELEQLLRYNLILAIVDLRWGDLFDMLKVPDGFVRRENVLDQLATTLKGIVNYLLKNANSSKNFELIPSVITDFDSLANQSNLVTMVKNLVGVLYTGGVTNKIAETVLPFINFILGWKTDPQVIKDPVIWTSFRDGNDYAFQWTGNGVYPTMDADNTLINVLNNSSGMLETHRFTDVTDHAYDIQIRSVTDDATKNSLKYTYSDGNGLVSPYETVAIKVGGTYSAEEAVTVTIAYDYVGKDGVAIGGTQYTSISFLISNQYEDSNVDGRWSGDDDDDYTGTNQYKKFVFTEDLYTSVTTYEPTIFYVKPSINLGDKSKSFSQICANGEQRDCDGNITKEGDVMTGQSTNYFEWIRDKNEAGWEDSISDGNPASGRLYKAKAGVTAETEFPYGDYDMGNIAVQYGGTMVYEVNFIYYNDYDIDVVYNENVANAYHANMGVDAAIYNEYADAWNDIVYMATYPMMTAMNDHASTAYVTTIQPNIPAAIERFEAAKEAMEDALIEVETGAGAGAELPADIVALAAEIDNDIVSKKEINFQDYNFYEYFNYNDVKVAAEEVYRSYLAPEVMDTYYILGSGIREAELNYVVDAEANSIVAAGILASRLENNAADINASQLAHDEWTQPVNTKLFLEDFISRLAYYKQFLNANTKENNDHMYFLNKEIAFVENQGLLEEDYTAASWASYQNALAVAKKVAAGNDEFASFNSRIYDVKYNLMVAYKNLLLAEFSLIENGGIADLEANVAIANEIFASLEAGDGVWTVAEDFEGEDEDAYAALISALGYKYQARYSKHDTEVKAGTKTAGEPKYNADGSPMMFNLYEDSALEYVENDRPFNQNNQAKVNASNAALETAIAYFVTAEEPAEPNTLVLNENAPFEAYIDYDNNIGGEYTGTIYGFDTLGWNENWEVDGAIADFVTTAYGDDYLEVIVPEDAGVETTGTIVNVLDDEGNVVESYVYIYYGDMDKDGNVGSSDAMLAFDYENLFEGIDDLATFMAGDLDADTMPGASDAMVMFDWENLYEGMPFQADVGAGVYGCIVYEIY
jgi:hypothetical protein